MKLKKYCFTFNSYSESLETIKICKVFNITPVFFIKYKLINGLSIYWLKELRELINNDFKQKDYQLCVDANKNYGLFINLVEININFIKIKANKNILSKLKNIAKLNKVSVNDNFSIIDLSKFKNKLLKIKKIYKKVN
ncbi:hypothetical protein N8X83_00120 [Alphaproteobacteria bacterium]|nr:hypothetical protein [Alphaproteobacteria bacterium]